MYILFIYFLVSQQTKSPIEPRRRRSPKLPSFGDGNLADASSGAATWSALGLADWLVHGLVHGLVVGYGWG